MTPPDSVRHVVISDMPYGASRVAYSLAKHMRKRMRVAVLINRELTGLFSGLPGAEVDVLPIDFKGSWKSLHRSPGLVAQYFASYMPIRRVTERSGTEIVHLHLPNAYALSFGHFGGTRKVFTIHGPMFESVARHFAGTLMRLGTAKGEALTAVKPSIAEYAERLARRRVWVIENGIDVEEVREKSVEDHDLDIKRLLALKEGSKGVRFVVSVGRLEWRKGQAQLLQAMRFLRNAQPKIMLILVGDGPNRREFELLAKSLLLSENIVFVGFKPNPYPFYNIADVVIGTLSSELVGLDLVEMEALALGKKVLTSYDKAKSEKAGSAVTYCDSKRPEEIAQKIVTLLEGITAKEAYEAANKLLELRSWSNVADQYLALYQTVSDRRR